ncbi:hypothetical protein ASZ90_001760 [hydrocarbon metagenome]|uniref:Uncharacterized protein n=1 Tax=hydrocarbon metagenome TaxID=938273 RepID=A0A0W8G5Q9_9ZZZZ
MFSRGRGLGRRSAAILELGQKPGLLARSAGRNAYGRARRQGVGNLGVVFAQRRHGDARAPGDVPPRFPGLGQIGLVAGRGVGFGIFQKGHGQFILGLGHIDRAFPSRRADLAAETGVGVVELLPVHADGLGHGQKVRAARHRNFLHGRPGLPVDRPEAQGIQVLENFQNRQEFGDVVTRLLFEQGGVFGQIEKVLLAALGHGPGDLALPGVVGGQGQVPVPEHLVEHGEILGGGHRGLVGIAAFVLPPVHGQAEPFGGHGHELPHAARPGMGIGHGVVAGFDKRKHHEVGRQIEAGHDRPDIGQMRFGPHQPAFHGAAFLHGEILEKHLDFLGLTHVQVELYLAAGGQGAFFLLGQGAAALDVFENFRIPQLGLEVGPHVVVFLVRLAFSTAAGGNEKQQTQKKGEISRHASSEIRPRHGDGAWEQAAPRPGRAPEKCRYFQDN